MGTENNIISRSADDYGELHASHVLEIYKMYVASAEATSARRQSANSFYLSVNTAVAGLAGYLSDSSSLFGWVISLAGILLCISWQRAVRAYKDLNTGKFKVIHKIERELPLSVYTEEWKALGQGHDPRLYLPFTRIEIWIPRVFVGLHLIVMLSTIPWAFIS